MAIDVFLTFLPKISLSISKKAMENLVCEPITTWEDLKSWSEDTVNPFTVCSQDLQERKLGKEPRTLPYKTLVCHDMGGGYLQDKWIQGCNEASYVFYQWNRIDMFVYFSHTFITIPPPAWINAAHKNGVQVLGTLITEWDEGKQLCQEMLSSESNIDMLVDRLVKIAQIYHFDGWLINIENHIQEESVPKLLDFVKTLTQVLHQEVAHSKVIWYDSVIKNGQLKWQDELNDNNKQFFEECDGIFLNYTWTKETLHSSHQVACQYDRVLDVYVGVDVFGRNCFGGGGFNTNAALTVIRDQGLSAAIFAPGWTYQRCDEQVYFLSNENKFWRLLQDNLTVCPISQLPLITSFCLGYGKRLYHQGRAIADTEWYNLSMQQRQATLCMPSINGANNCATAEPSIIDGQDTTAFDGASCLKLMVWPKKPKETFTYNLFSLNLVTSSELCVSYTFKLDTQKCVCKDVWLEIKTNEKCLKFCDFSKGDQSRPTVGEPEAPLRKNTKIVIDGVTPGVVDICYVPDGESCHTSQGTPQSNWITRKYTIAKSDTDGLTLLGLNLQLCCWLNEQHSDNDGEGSNNLKVKDDVGVGGDEATSVTAYLGHLLLTTTDMMKDLLQFRIFDEMLSNVVIIRYDTEESNTRCLSCTLSWSTTIGKQPVYCHVLTEQKHTLTQQSQDSDNVKQGQFCYLGSTFNNAFHIRNLEVEEKIDKVRFFIKVTEPVIALHQFKKLIEI